ncbi:hypothetical protein ABZ614_15135 [Streptomyces sp. NPDC013178]|uniref:hypothetical protein n=1 Tax=unclassified Streptomyces TaxID=2593676 RepID=UPI0033D183B8
MRLPDRELVFFSRPMYQERWIEENRLLEFRCEFRSTYPATRQPVLARLRARLVVRWVEGLPYMDKVGPRLRTAIQRHSPSRLSRVGVGVVKDLMPSFTLDGVEDVDFAMALDGNKVFEVSETEPEQEWQSLVIGGTCGSVRISNIGYHMIKSVAHMTEIRSGRTSA